MENYVDSTLHELTTHGTVDFPCVVYGDSYRTRKDQYYYSHYHEEIEIITCLRGDIKIQVNEKIYLLRKGDILLINSNVVHYILHKDYPDSYAFAYLFHPSILKFPSSSRIDTDILEYTQKKIGDAVLISDSPLHISFLELARKYRKEEIGYPLDFIITIYQLYNHIYKNPNLIQGEDFTSATSEKVRDAIHYIYDHYMNEITLSDIASVMNLSEGEASRVFKRITHKSPIEYVIHYRIHTACHYLKNTDKSITDIAILVGFSSSNYFTIAFKKINGMTPKEYRKQ